MTSNFSIKNLNFIPNPGRYNKHTFEKDTNAFFRSTILKSHFGNGQAKTYLGYKPKSNKNWLPKDIHHSVKTFIESLKDDMNSTTTTNSCQPHTRSNLTKGEIDSLYELKNRDDIIVTKADKGGAVVIMNVDDYIKEANRQLNNTEFYTKLITNPTTTNYDIVNNTIQTFVKEKLLPEQVAKALVVDNPKTARFYLLPKVHKENIPGRPITNAINSPTSSPPPPTYCAKTQIID